MYAFNSITHNVGTKKSFLQSFITHFPKNWSTKGKPWQNVCMCVCLYMCEELKLLASNVIPICQCVTLYANIWVFSSCWLFIAKTKLNVMADDGLRCVICVLRHRVLTPALSHTHTHTHRASKRERSQASSLHMHIFHHLAKMPANKPLFTDIKQHEYLFSETVDIHFYSSAPDNLNIALVEMHGVLLKGSEKSTHYIPLSAKMQKDMARERK